jgi:type IV pilus assembly protein PilV
MQQQSGMTFIEVLIALVIIVAGILGSVAMQATAKRGSFDAMQRSLASSLAQDMVSRMRASDATNLGAYIGNDYGNNNYPEPVSRCQLDTALCTPGEMVANDQYEWELALMGGDVVSGGQNAGGLIGAVGCISQVGNSMQVVISWQGRESIQDSNKLAGCGLAGDKRRQVLIAAFII